MNQPQVSRAKARHYVRRAGYARTGTFVVPTFAVPTFRSAMSAATFVVPTFGRRATLRSADLQVGGRPVGVSPPSRGTARLSFERQPAATRGRFTS